MLSRLTFEQISKHWEVIEYAIENSMPPLVKDVESPDIIQNILASLMNGSMQCWASYRREESKNTFEGFMITTITIDYCSKIKSLLLYSVFGYVELTKQTWVDGFEAISKYARSIGCSTITAFSDKEDIIRAAKMVGGNADFRLLVFIL